MGVMTASRAGEALAGLLRGYSTEVIPRDQRSIEAACDLLPRGSEVFIAAVPGEIPDRMVAAAARLRAAGLTPAPHITARSFASLDDADRLIGRLAEEAGVDRVLALGGDRDRPAGQLHSSRQLIASGLLRKHGLRKVFIACYPERHPRVEGEVLEAARRRFARATIGPDSKQNWLIRVTSRPWPAAISSFVRRAASRSSSVIRGCRSG